MQRVSGVTGMESGDIDTESTNMVLKGVKKLMRHKYGDVFLLCSVAAAFGTLLIISALG
jgi:hypothetical protein